MGSHAYHSDGGKQKQYAALTAYFSQMYIFT